MSIHDSLTEAERLQAVTLLQDLIRLRSVNPPGDEATVAEAVARQAERWGLEVKLDPVAERRPNALIRLRGSGERPALMFSGHSDTVPPGEAPWQYDPFSGELIDGRIWGRGAVDMKAGVVAMLCAMGAVAQRSERLKGDLYLALTVGEEADSCGARHLYRTGGLAGVGWIVIGEPTNLDVVAAHRGAIWLEIVAHGKTAHGSMPHLGVNAIDHLCTLLGWLREKRFSHTPHPLLAPPTMNVGTIAGGVKTNVVPDYCVATVDFRTLPGQEHAAILQEVRDLADELASTVPGLAFEVRVGNDMPPVETPVGHPLVQAMHAAAAATGASPRTRGASYYTDGGAWIDSGIPMVIFGPGDDRLAHQPNEYVEVVQVVDAIRAYLALIEQLLS